MHINRSKDIIAKLPPEEIETNSEMYRGMVWLAFNAPGNTIQS